MRPLSHPNRRHSQRLCLRGDRAILGLSPREQWDLPLRSPPGFTIVWFDSVGDPNAEERQLASELAPVDVAIFPWTPHPISETQLAYTFQHLQLFRPGLYLPDHHDGIWGLWLDNGLAPLIMKIRDDLPATKFTEPLYRSATCVDTSVVARGRRAAR